MLHYNYKIVIIYMFCVAFLAGVVSCFGNKTHDDLSHEYNNDGQGAKTRHQTKNMLAFKVSKVLENLIHHKSINHFQ